MDHRFPENLAPERIAATAPFPQLSLSLSHNTYVSTDGAFNRRELFRQGHTVGTTNHQ
jgi:hypothetical protein